MSSASRRAVFDCNVFLQAIISDRGPAAGCVGLVFAGEVNFFISSYVLDELRATPAHHDLRRFSLTQERVERFIRDLLSKAAMVSIVPDLFTGCRDRKDNHYVNLALATGSEFVVSRDRDLTDLMNSATPDGRAFHGRFPGLRILDPAAFLREVEGDKNGRRRH